MRTVKIHNTLKKYLSVQRHQPGVSDMIMTLGVMAFAAAFMLANPIAAYADIPAWVRDVAGLWSEGSIDDDTYSAEQKSLSSSD